MNLQTFLQDSDKSPILDIPVGDFVHFSHDVVNYRSYLICRIDDQVAGMIVFTEQTRWLENGFGLGVVTVSPKFKNQGVGKFLVEHFFQLAKLHGKDVRVTPYEKEGELYLRHVIRRVAREYDVQIVEA